MKKLALLCAVLLAPALAAASCVLTTGGLVLNKIRLGDPSSTWVGCVNTSLDTISAIAMDFSGSTTTPSYFGPIYTNKIGGRNTGALMIEISSGVYLDPTSYLTDFGSMTVTGGGGLGVTYGVTAATFTGNGAALTALTAANISAGTATGLNITGNAATATALAATPTTAASGYVALGVAASGNVVAAHVATSGVSGSTEPVTSGALFTHAALSGTSAHGAASANTASAIVARDGSGNFTAGTITAALSGNATTATTGTNLAGGLANEVPYQTGAGATTFTGQPGANVVLTANSGAPAWSNTPTLTGTNISAIPAATALTGQVPVANGGTAGATASAARSNLSAAQSGANADISSLAGTGAGITISTNATVSTMTITSKDASGYSLTTSSGINVSAGQINLASGSAGIVFPDGSRQMVAAAGGTGDVTKAGNNTFSGNNVFGASTTISGLLIAPGSGMVIQSSQTVRCTAMTATGNGPSLGNTAPTTSNGTEYAAAAITVRNASSRVRITATASIQCGGTDDVLVFVFVNAGGTAVTTGMAQSSSTGETRLVRTSPYEYAPGATGLVTAHARFGSGAANTLHLNADGSNTTGEYGNTICSSVLIEEISP